MGLICTPHDGLAKGSWKSRRRNQTSPRKLNSAGNWKKPGGHYPNVLQATEVSVMDLIERYVIENDTQIAAYAAVLASLLLFLMFDMRKVALKAWKRGLIALLVNYVCYVGVMILLGRYLEWRVNGFDLDGDQVFTDAEATAELDFFVHHFIIDTDLTFAPIVGIIPAAFALAIAYILTLARRGGARLIRAALARA